MSRRASSVVALSILLAASGFAQEARPRLPRAKALGEVRNKGGKAWAEAKVFLVSWPVSGNIHVGSADTLEIRTDERGRFRAQILEGRYYTVWAQGKPDPDGNLRVSNVAEQVIPQVPVLLKERKELVAPQKVRIEGLDKWADHKPFRGRVVDQEDKGLEGVTMHAYPQWNGRMPHLESDADDEEAELPADRNGVRLAGFGNLRDPHSLFYSLIGRRNVKTGKDGSFTLAVPRIGLQYSLSASLKMDGAWRRANTRVLVDAKEGVEDIELVLR